MAGGIAIFALTITRLFVRLSTAHPARATTGVRVLDRPALLSHLRLHLPLISTSCSYATAKSNASKNGRAVMLECVSIPRVASLRGALYDRLHPLDIGFDESIKVRCPNDLTDNALCEHFLSDIRISRNSAHLLRQGFNNGSR